MATQIAFLVRSTRILSILLSVICLLGAGEAQHGGGGGGHSGGGHFGGGHSSGTHSSGSHSGGHLGWLHFGFGKHSARRAGSGASSISDASSYGLSRLWYLSTPARTPSLSGIPSTLLWSPPLLSRRLDRQASFVSSRMRPQRGFLYNRFRRFPSSGCFLNGVTQVCFFEPFLPLLCFSGYFDLSYFGFGGDSLDWGDDINSHELMQSEMSAIPAPGDPSDDDSAKGNSPVRPGGAFGAATEDQALGNGVFLLVLNNGASRTVTDYWIADGYLEYISPDGTRGHIPLEALDLQNTVTQNAFRGLPFVLRSVPAQNR